MCVWVCVCVCVWIRPNPVHIFTQTKLSSYCVIVRYCCLSLKETSDYSSSNICETVKSWRYINSGTWLEQPHTRYALLETNRGYCIQVNVFPDPAAQFTNISQLSKEGPTLSLWLRVCWEAQKGKVIREMENEYCSIKVEKKKTVRKLYLRLKSVTLFLFSEERWIQNSLTRWLLKYFPTKQFCSV
jgi:hypothetical protein